MKRLVLLKDAIRKEAEPRIREAIRRGIDMSGIHNLQFYNQVNVERWAKNNNYTIVEEWYG